jgi:hypothetical protein
MEELSSMKKLSEIDSFFNTPTAGRGVQLDLYPTCIQAQRTVGASKPHGKYPIT